MLNIILKLFRTIRLCQSDVYNVSLVVTYDRQPSVIKFASVILVILVSGLNVQAQNFYGFPSYEDSTQSFQPFAYFGSEPLWEDFRNFEGHQVYGQIGSAIGQLETILEVDGKRLSGAYGCTATLIAEDIIITNYHCVPNGESRIELVNAFLRMDFLTAGETGDLYPVDIRVLESNESLDYAILRVENAPGRTYGFVPLRYRSAVESEELFMIHHSKAKPKQITRRNCTLLRADQLEQLPIEMVGEFRQFNSETDRPHRCDSEEGSSGALVFAYSDGAIVGLHFAGTSSQLPVQQRANIFIDMTTLVEQSTQLRSLAQRITNSADRPQGNSQTPNGSGLSSQISLIEDAPSAVASTRPRPEVTAESGFLNLLTEPLGADVYINQEFIGQTPIEQYPLTKGRYDLRISRSGYDVIDGYFQVIAGQSTDGDISLVAQEGTVVADETSSTNQVDESQVITPFPTTAPETQSNDVENPLDISDESTQHSLGNGDVRENFGSITVYSEPIGAEVFVNEKLIGMTPLIAYALDLGVYDITLNKEGYEIYRDRASIARSRNTDVTVRLTEVEALPDPNFNQPASITDSEEQNPEVQEQTDASSTVAINANQAVTREEEVVADSDTTPLTFATPTEDQATGGLPKNEQAAITSVEEFIRQARAGGVIRLGEGRFDINDALSLNNDLEIIGSGADKTIISSSAEGYVFRTSNMKFKASGLSIVHTSGRWGNVLVGHDSQVDIQQVNVSGAIWDSTINQGGMGLWLTGSSAGIIKQSTFENNQLHGIYLSDASEPVLESNLIRNNGQNGVLYLGSSSGLATANVLESNGLHGISVGGQARPSIENNTLRNNGETGITYFENARGIALANLSETNGTYGISVVGSSEARIEQNTIRSNTITGLLYAGQSRSLAKGNLISANTINGITINEGAQLELVDNRIDGNFWYGVYFDGSAQTSLENNTIENNRAGRSNR